MTYPAPTDIIVYHELRDDAHGYELRRHIAPLIDRAHRAGRLIDDCGHTGTSARTVLFLRDERVLLSPEPPQVFGLEGSNA